MAVIRDTIPAFELFQPSSLEDALTLKRRYGKASWAYAGGLDSLDWFKDRIKRPDAVIDLGGIEELRGIRDIDEGGVEIGAMTTLTEMASHAPIPANPASSWALSRYKSASVSRKPCLLAIPLSR